MKKTRILSTAMYGNGDAVDIEIADINGAFNEGATNQRRMHLTAEFADWLYDAIRDGTVEVKGKDDGKVIG